MSKRWLVASVVVWGVLAGCGDDAEPTLDVVGVWEVTGGGAQAQVTYQADGSYRIAPYDGDTLLTHFDRGTYEVDGTTITYTSSDGVLGCAGGEVGIYTIATLDDGSWSVTAVEDECVKRLEGTPFTHQSP